MSTMDIDDDPTTVLVTLREEIDEKDSELASVFYTMEDLYERKLWFQLSEVLSKTVFKNNNSKSIRLKLYDNFILTFSEKINQLQLVEFLINSLTECSLEDSLEYLNTLKSKVQNFGEKKLKKSVEEDITDNEIIQSLIFIEIESAKIKLELGFVDESAKIIDQCSKKIENLTASVDNRINASYYFTNAKLMKINGDYNSFYYNSLLFLACINNLDDLEDKEKIVEDICISGILGNKIYNFGEIIMHEIFKYLKVEWLKNLLLSLNSGDLASFEKIISSAEVNSINEISSSIEFLKQKICIMALIELVFNKPSNNKTITYEELLQKIPLLTNNDEVEHLTMKCLSLGLIKGLINQVLQEIEISWIQPRTMTNEQIISMKDQLSVWSDKVTDLDGYMRDSGKELWV